MKDTRKFHHILFLIIFALLLRAPGIPWGLINYDSFEPDEGQHVGVASEVISKFDNNYINDDGTYRNWNARGFGTQLAVFSYPILKILSMKPYFLYGFARLLTLVYSILLILLIYVISLNIYNDMNIALLSALLLSIMDLNITYSHYGVPDIPHVFWAYFAIFLIFLYSENQKQAVAGDESEQKKHISYELLEIGVALSAAMGLSFRFDILPTIILIGSLVWLFLSKKITSKRFAYLVVKMIVLICGFFYISVAFDYNLADIIASKNTLFSQNANVVLKDTHYLHNPILYFFAILGGSSFFIVTLFCFSAIYFLKAIDKERVKFFHTFMILFLFFSFVILWIGDCTFVRRANIFLPYVAMMCGWGLVRFYEYQRFLGNKLLKKGLIGVVILYTLSLSIVSQAHFVVDPRYATSEYLNEHSTGADVIIYSPYAKVKSMPAGFGLEEFGKDVSVIVLHEAYYGRYWKYFTTPFKIPRCCDEVYHCDFDDCKLIQGLLSNDLDFRLIKSFRVWSFFPERILFEHLFGSYETFLGNVLVYRRVGRG